LRSQIPNREASVFSFKKPEVLVVGAGPVGLFTALALAQRGVRVQIIDKEPCSGSHSNALALHAESLRLLDELGVLSELLEGAHRVRRMGLYDGGQRKTELRISDLPQDHSFLAVLPQDRLEQRLVGALSKRGVKVEWCHEVSQLAVRDEHCDVQIDTMAIDTLGYSVQHSEWVVAKSRQHEIPFVIGADGLASVVRRRLEIPFPAVGPSSNFAVFEFQTDAALGDELRLMLNEKTTNACWPLPDGYCRCSFELPPDEAGVEAGDKDRSLYQLEAINSPSLTEARLRELLAERAPWFRGSIGNMRWRMMVHFEKRLAASFGRGRAWLLGDAGHVTGPVGIHSMNSGFREATQLATAIAGALRGKTGKEPFARYEASRHAEWRGLLGMDDVLQAGPKTDPWIASRKDRLVACIPALGDDFVRLAGQLGLQAAQGAVAAH
jgi:2-polyprenyl-6-methoxyphenol hydroxylase-like FAD-dependent oxidoreductase